MSDYFNKCKRRLSNFQSVEMDYMDAMYVVHSGDDNYFKVGEYRVEFNNYQVDLEPKEVEELYELATKAAEETKHRILAKL